jgi:hypothetical protein
VNEPTPQPRDHRQPGHFWADNEIIDVYLPQIGLHAFAVYMLFTKFANARNGQCDPSIPTIARMLGISETTVKKSIKKLKDHGLISVEPRQHSRRPNQHNTNLYTLLTVPKVGHPVTQGVGHLVTQGGTPGDPGVGHQVPGNNTHKNNTQLTRKDSLSQAANAAATVAPPPAVEPSLPQGHTGSDPQSKDSEPAPAVKLDGWYVVRGDTAWGPQASYAQCERIVAAGGGIVTQGQALRLSGKRVLTPLPEPDASKPQEALAQRKRAAARPRPRNLVGDAVARAFFGAKDEAGIEAVFGRVAPILYGDKRGGRCDGLFAYEKARSGREIDHQALAADVYVFKAWLHRTKPDIRELKDCAKFIDHWQEWRGLVQERSNGWHFDDLQGVWISPKGNKYAPGDDMSNG